MDSSFRSADILGMGQGGGFDEEKISRSDITKCEVQHSRASWARP
jgi:hypothetical protein